MTKLAVILSLAIFLVAAEAWAQPGDQNGVADPDVTRRCQSYLECTLIWSGCGDVAINKKYAGQFKPSTACLQSTAHDPKAVATCTDRLCVVSTTEEKK